MALVSGATCMALASCGGGGGDSGDSTSFTTSPRTIAYTFENGTCDQWHIGNTKVTVIGGLAPFRIHNAQPDRVVLDKTELTGQDPVFTIQYVGGCDSTYTLTILDVHSRSTVFTITTSEADAAAAQ